MFKRGDLICYKCDRRRSILHPPQIVFDIINCDKDDIQLLYLHHPVYNRIDWWLSFEWDLIQGA